MANPVGRPPIMREPGKYVNLANEEYHADPYYFSSSQLKEALVSPAHFRHYVMDKRGRKKATKALDRGSLVHTVVLEPWRIEDEYFIYDGDLTPTGLIPVSAKNYYAKTHPNHKLITHEEYSVAKRARTNLEAYPQANKLLFSDKCEYEVSYFTKCNETGLNLRIRPDAINVEDGYIIDLKTTKARTKHEFIKDALYNYDYDLSCFMYLKVMNDITGKKFDYWWFTVGNEDMAPAAMYRVTDKTIESGKAKYYRAIDNIKTALTLTDEYRYQMEPDEI